MTIAPRNLSRLVILIAVAMGAARICSAQLLYEPSLYKGPGERVGRTWPTTKPEATPMFSSNDRSRWAMVHALVDDGTFAIGHREDRAGATPPYKDTGNAVIFNRETGKWKSLDIVLRPDTNEFLSSKPPLLSVLVAGLYWVLKTLFGWTLVMHPFLVVRTILLVVNLVPFAIYLVLIDRWLNRYALHEWARLVLLTAAAFGTIVTPFLITLNNHTFATFAVMFAVDAVLSIHHAQVRPRWRSFVAAGFWAAFATVNEMPALAFAAGVFLWLGWTHLKPTLMIALPVALLVAAAYFGTNYAEMGQWKPAYLEFGSIGGGWYDYPGSYWKPPAKGEIRYGIDFARMHETWSTYAMHCLVGHHGFFSLTPIWLLAVAGMFVWRPRPPDSGEAVPWFVPFATAGITVVVIGFWLYKSDNYSGWSNGLRWLMWLSPLLLFTMIPIVDRLAESRRGRVFVCVLLAASIFAAHYSLWNPWRMPWIYDLMLACGWDGYYPLPFGT
jgi:hypothetical protein